MYGTRLTTGTWTYDTNKKLRDLRFFFKKKRGTLFSLRDPCLFLYATYRKKKISELCFFFKKKKGEVRFFGYHPGAWTREGRSPVGLGVGVCG